MKKIAVVFSAFVLLLGLFGVAGAFTIDHSYVAVGNQFTSPYAAAAGFYTQNFESATLGTLTGSGWALSGDGQVVTGDSYGVYSAPMGVDGTNKDATKYLTVPTDLTVPNYVEVSNLGGIGGTFNYLGLWWGSIDYTVNDINNVIRFYKNGVLTDTVTGAMASIAHDGNQVAPGTNLYVNIYNLQPFDSYQIESNRFAFESDNHTVGTIPEPGMMMLVGSGLVGLAGWGRKKFRK